MIKIKSLQKKILRIMIPTFLMIFSFIFIPNVKALDITGKSGRVFENIASKKVIIYDMAGIDSSSISRLRYAIIPDSTSYLYSDSIYFVYTNDYLKFVGRYEATSLSSWKTMSTSTSLSVYGIEGFIEYSYLDVWNEDHTEILYCGDVETECKPSSYEFDGDILVTDISKVKVKFELPEDTSSITVDLDYKISSFGDGNLGMPYLSRKGLKDSGEITGNTYESSGLVKSRDDIIGYIQNAFYLDFGQGDASLDDDEIEIMFNGFIEDLNNISKDDLFKDEKIKKLVEGIFYYSDSYDSVYDLSLKYVNEDYYSGFYKFTIYAVNSSTTELSFIVDTSNLDGDIHLSFRSNMNYTFEYEYQNDIKDYLVTVDMNSYSSIIFIPKTDSISLSLQSQFYLSGVYDIEIWDDIDSKNILYRKTNFKDFVFFYKSIYVYDGSIYYFIKKPSSDICDYYITFDSRYYNYVLKEYLSEEVEIINPNTGESIIIGDISNLYEYVNKDSSKFTFNSFLKPIKFVFESISNFYNNYCPAIVQQFFYLVFMFFVILLVIKLFL